jgi:hypothetical protein
LIIVLKILNISFSNYRGANNFIKFNEIFYSILNSYHFFMSFYFKNDILNNTFIYKRHFFNLIIIIFIIINFILIIKKNFKNNSNQILKKYLILLLIFIFPIVINFVSVITNQKTIYLLMTESYFLLYLILIVQLDCFKFNKLKFIKIISYIIIFILIGSFVIADNATYEAQTIFNNKLHSLGNQLAFEINNREEYENKNILIIGDMEFKIQNNRLLNLINFDFYKNYSAYSYASFFKNNNYFINDFYSDDNLVEEIKNKNEFKNMKEYSIKIINNIIIIKLKNT